MRWLACIGVALWASVEIAVVVPTSAATSAVPVQFVFTSDAHYGLARATFRGAVNVPASVVNRALVAVVNSVPATRFPPDDGLRAGLPVGPLDFIVEGGDTTNRPENTGEHGIQAAAMSWTQFERDYIEGLTTRTPSGARTRLSSSCLAIMKRRARWASTSR
jgi:hypothetical protein